MCTAMRSLTWDVTGPHTHLPNPILLTLFMWLHGSAAEAVTVRKVNKTVCVANQRHLWPSGISSCLGRNRLWVRFLADVGYIIIYPMFIEPTITWVPSGFSGYIWLDTKIVLKNQYSLVYPDCIRDFRIKFVRQFWNLYLYSWYPHNITIGWLILNQIEETVSWSIINHFDWLMIKLWFTIMYFTLKYNKHFKIRQ